MGISTRCIAAAALAAALAACGGPPDDVAEAARKSRVATEQSREGSATQSAGAPAQRDTAPVQPQRSIPRDLPPVSSARAPGATSPATASAPDRSTAVMGAGPAPASAPQAAASGTAADDALITSRVRGALNADREVGPLHLDVDTRGGVVTLSGTVPTAAARARAGDVAKSVKDVKSVNDQLTLATT